MDQHRVMHGLDETLEQLLASREVRTALLEILEQLIDGGAQLFEGLGLALKADAPGCAGFEREAPDLLGQIAHRSILTPFPSNQHRGDRDRRGQDAQPY
jgi:hypothetical protein